MMQGTNIQRETKNVTLPKDLNDPHPPKPLFIAKTANEWIAEASLRPIPKQLFTCFWYQGEVSILFADTNVGKSILAVQIAEQISGGISKKEFKTEAGNQKVLYFDFELSDKQFEYRYSTDYSNHFNFADNFIRLEIDPESDPPDDLPFEDFLHRQIENQLKETGAKVLVIDNLTYLSDQVEKAKTALPLMKRLQALKKRYDLSILILAHTPKRDLSKPLTRNDLQGSRALLGFCDSAFAIGESHRDSSMRYLKQIKVRHGEFTHDAENVMVCRIEKEVNFLEFRFVEYGRERDHLKEPTDKEIDQLEQSVFDLKEEGYSLRAIADQLGISHMKVKRIIDRKADQSEGEEEAPF